MTNDEIMMRIAIDANSLEHYRSIKDVTIGMTRGLYKKLFPEYPEYFVLHDNSKMILFGCEVKIIESNDEWWIVGYLGSAEEGEL